MGEKRNIYKVLIGKPEGNISRKTWIQMREYIKCILKKYDERVKK
jgi:hypothetical protein